MKFERDHSLRFASNGYPLRLFPTSKEAAHVAKICGFGVDAKLGGFEGGWLFFDGENWRDIDGVVPADACGGVKARDATSETAA